MIEACWCNKGRILQWGDQIDPKSGLYRGHKWFDPLEALKNTNGDDDKGMLV